MRRGAPAVALVLAAVVTLASAGALAVAWSSSGQSWSTLTGSIRLREARLQVSAAERSLGKSDIANALASINRSNRTALRISSLTSRIVRLLSPTSNSASQAVSLAERGAGGADRARRLVSVIAQALGTIAGYQQAGSGYAALTNRALHRILGELRRTNRSFPVP